MSAAVPARRWQYAATPDPMIVGFSLVSTCGPHMHDTYTIAYLREGDAVVQSRGRQMRWRAGQLFLGNPFEIHAGGGGGRDLQYEVCYPSADLVEQAIGQPEARFGATIISSEQPCTDLRRALRALTQCGSSVDAEANLACCLRRHREALRLGVEHAEPKQWIVAACRAIEDAVESGCVEPFASEAFGCCRSNFIRQFRQVTGTTPYTYYRQLRLAKAARLLIEGRPIADVAVLTGFADQAHLTREFKRSYGTPPGKLVRDLAASRPGLH